MPSENTRRIAKNTGFLYVRMLLMLGVAFYTSRIVLNALGVEDYGIYNVVGGVVAMFSLFIGAFTSCTQRFLNYEMGRGNGEKLRDIFCMGVSLNALMAFVVVVIAEVFGVWFINNKLVVPPGRLFAAHWVFQFSIWAAVVKIVSTPYNAVIIAHEKMSIFAGLSIVEELLKLSIALVVFFYGGDRLILYGLLVLGVALISRGIYSVYCRRRFPECHYRFYWNKAMFYEMGSFAGWNFYGSFAFLMITQGLNMLLNVFFGPVVNASRAIAVQVEAAIRGFAGNFTVAADPRITQDYAQGAKEEAFGLIVLVSKYSFFLLLLLSSPVIAATESVLQIWLKQVPEYSVIFVRLVLCQMLIRILQSPLHTLLHATGKMKLYQLLDGTLLMLNIPISYLLLRNGFEAYWVFIVSAMIVGVELFVLLWVAHREADFPVWHFARRVLLPVVKTLVPVAVFVLLIIGCSVQLDFYLQLILRVLFTGIFTVAVLWFVGMKRGERDRVGKYIKSFFRRIK